MSIKMLNATDWLVQVQRAGQRRTRRGTGGRTEAAKVERELLAELESEAKMADAAALLGVQLEATPSAAPGQRNVRIAPPAPTSPTVRAFYNERWIPHAKTVQNPTTQRAQIAPFAYILHHIGDRPLDAYLRRSEVNVFVERLKETGPLSFKTRKDGQPMKRKRAELKAATVNKILASLKALLNLAHAEEVIAEAPRIDLLPQDDSLAVIPPTEDELEHLIEASEGFREIAPLLPEVIAFTAETGLRRGEVFHLTWRSVELKRERSSVRIEMQQKGRVVNGRVWKPKHGKYRIVPLTKRAQALLLRLREQAQPEVDDLVFPNVAGCPYERMDGAPKGSGVGWFSAAVEAAGLKGKVTFHSLRHYFAVRCLTANIPITVVSEMLGHSHIEITVKRYGRFSSDAQVKWESIGRLDEQTRVALPPPRADGDEEDAPRA